METHYSILAWRIPWMEEPDRVQSMGSQRVGHNLGTEHNANSLRYLKTWVNHKKKKFLSLERAAEEHGGPCFLTYC